MVTKSPTKNNLQTVNSIFSSWAVKISATGRHCGRGDCLVFVLIYDFLTLGLPGRQGLGSLFMEVGFFFFFSISCGKCLFVLQSEELKPFKLGKNGFLLWDINLFIVLPLLLLFSVYWTLIIIFSLSPIICCIICELFPPRHLLLIPVL